MSKILVADDDDFVRGLICSVLKKNGYTVSEAKNGEEAVTMARKDSPDILITDMLMPDKEGIETILEVKEIGSNIKIIAISGGGKTKNMSFLNIAQNAGADAILSKPFKPDELLQAINTLRK